MVINGSELLKAAPIIDMLATKYRSPAGVSYGLVEVGYDIRLKQDIWFYADPDCEIVSDDPNTHARQHIYGNFVLASTIEEFNMPMDLCAIVHDKSTWARQGLSVFNTVIEPGWKGFLTLELVFHGQKDLHLPTGTGIAQVIFHETAVLSSYDGKYQNQEDRPIESLVS